MPDDSADPMHKGSGIELRPKNLIWAIGQVGNTPVAHERDLLVLLRRLHLGADMLRLGDAFFALDIDQDQVVRPARKHGKRASAIHSGIDMEARYPENLVAQGSQHLPATQMEDRWRDVATCWQENLDPVKLCGSPRERRIGPDLRCKVEESSNTPTHTYFTGKWEPGNE